MNERQLIDEAAAAKIELLFNALFQAYTLAAGDATGEQRAEATFRSGVLNVRHVRERALANLPP